MGGIFGVVGKDDCVTDLFFGVDYHSHLGTRRGGMAVFDGECFNRVIHNIENSPFRTKFERDVDDLHGYMGIGCIRSLYLYRQVLEAIPSPQWARWTIMMK